MITAHVAHFHIYFIL